MSDQSNQTSTKLASHYDNDFYADQIQGSLRSARAYAKHLTTFYRPERVVDIGCGRGTWLTAFRETGTSIAVGFDGPWNRQENMLDPEIRFHGMDLNAPPPEAFADRFDLAISLEVAEHLEERSAAGFVQTLTRLADVVMFGAAYTKQGGTNHINEQPHTYWAKHYANQGFLPYDVFRPTFWNDPQVEYWYQQNTFVYVKNGSDAASRFLAAGYAPMVNAAFMDCIHPRLYHARLAQIGFKPAIQSITLERLRSKLLSMISIR